jgi:hypothetical protein
MKRALCLALLLCASPALAQTEPAPAAAPATPPATPVAPRPESVTVSKNRYMPLRNDGDYGFGGQGWQPARGDSLNPAGERHVVGANHGLPASHCKFPFAPPC